MDVSAACNDIIVTKDNADTFTIGQSAPSFFGGGGRGVGGGGSGWVGE